MRKTKLMYVFLLLLITISFSGCFKSKPTEQPINDNVTPTVIPTKNPSEEITMTPIPKDSIVDDVEKLPKINVTSETLNKDGKWKSIITNTNIGKNQSPQLSWTPVESAAYYAVYMFDISAQNWLHWFVQDLTDTKLDFDTKIKNSEYVGPYPPKGDAHTYVVTVYALKGKPDRYSGALDSMNLKPEKILECLDTSNKERGNILATGTISGTYKNGESVK